jgi:hypothetical protein
LFLASLFRAPTWSTPTEAPICGTLASCKAVSRTLRTPVHPHANIGMHVRRLGPVSSNMAMLHVADATQTVRFASPRSGLDHKNCPWVL